MGTGVEASTDSKLVNLYAAISVGGTRLFVAQNEIRSLEPAVDLDLDEPPLAGVGWITFGGCDWPVYCLAGDLSPSSELPVARRVCILLNAHQGYFGLMCDRLEVISENRLQPVPLQAIMRAAHTPVQALALYEGAPGFVISASGLLAFLDFCAGDGDGQAQSAPSH
jgi:hypothetical protein